MKGSPGERDVLIVTDPQRDFCPGGALAAPGGDAVMPAINRLARHFAHVVITQDWHPPGHMSFASAHPGRKPFETIEAGYGPQTLWPDHCVQNTSGAAFHPALDVPHAELVIRKGYHPGIRFLFGVSRERQENADRACRLSARARLQARDPVRPRDRFLRVLLGD